MAMSVTLAQPFAAQFGQPTNFVATVANSSGGNVNLNSLTARVSTSSGQAYLGAQIGQAYPSGQTSIAQSGGYQFNVVIPASGNVAFGFTIQIIGNPLATGAATQAGNSFFVTVDCYSSDGTSFSAQAPLTMLAQPTFGPALSAGTPSNQWVGSFPTFGTAAAAPGQPGTMSFQVSSNAVLAL